MPSASTSDTCDARPRRAASRGCCTPCAASATSCATNASVPLSKRLSLVAAGAVAIAVAIACFVSYEVVRMQLLNQIDSELISQAQSVQSDPGHSLAQPLPANPASSGGPAPYQQVVLADGSIALPDPALKLPGTPQAAAVAAGQPAFMNDVTVNGTILRMYTFPLVGVNVSGEQVAVQLARP